MRKTSLLLLIVVMTAAAGCFPNSSAGRLGPAPVILNDMPSPEYAQYRRNRPAAPEQYQVFPKPPRNNTFGEFDDDLHDERGRQPELPRLAEDSLQAMAAPNYPMPPSGFATGFAPPAAAPGAPRPAGVTANNSHFYPLEQLVYGGEYPDLDQPDAYRLMPKDVISVTVKDHPEFSGKIEIQPDGTVRVPNAPDLIRLRGLTPDEAADELRRVLGVYVRGECVVRVQTNRAKGGYYFVFGDVLQPGRFPMGLEPVKLSDAVLAANWEANPGRFDADGDDLGPSFPAAAPRGKFIAPPSADMARVMLITPHRSQPVRTTHDIRSAMLGITANDPPVRPGQIIVVPSLRAEQNRILGIPMGDGFAGSAASARLPEAFPDNGPADYMPAAAPKPSEVEENMAASFEVNNNAPESYPLEDSPPAPSPIYETRRGEASIARREIGREVIVETGRGGRPRWFGSARNGEEVVVERIPVESQGWEKGF